MVTKISENNFRDSIKDGVCVVDFSASWCGPCKMLAPVLEGVSEELAGKVKFFNVDVDENPKLSDEFTIMSVPTLLLFKDGEAQAIQSGFMNEDMLKAFIDRSM